MDDEAGSGKRDLAEARRIRAVYSDRDRRHARHPAIAEAYRRINADRLSRTHALVDAMSASDHPRIIDVGCGGGLDLAFWRAVGWPADALAGIDLVTERISLARQRCPGVDLRVTSGTQIPFADGAYDLATAVTVFSSILDEKVRRALFMEMCRVVRPGGSVLVYDFVIRNPGNHDVVAMTLPRLRALGGPPSESMRMTPLVQLVALGTRFGRRGADLAMRIAPPTHRLSRWRVG